MSVEVGGTQVLSRFPTRKAAAVLAYVASARSSGVSRDALVEMFWPEDESRAGRASLSTTLNRVRTSCTEVGAPEILHADREFVWLAPHVETDTSEFDRLTAKGGMIKDPAESAVWLQAAFDLYTAQLLLSENYDWVLAERQMYSDEYVRTVRSLVSHLGELGRTRDAIQVARRATRIEPTREFLARDLMRLLRNANEPSAALEAYHNLQAALKSAFDLKPSDRTADLAEEIASELAAQHDHSQSAPIKTARPISLFVGRQHERNLIRSSEARLITIVGFGGVGKSRLAREAAVDFQDCGRGNAVWIALDGYTSADSIWVAIGEAFNIYGPTQGSVIERLRGVDCMLIIDNAEHLIPAIGTPIALILGQCPFLKMLVTSRVPLNIDGEMLIRLSPLGSGEGPDSEDVVLFCDRFRAAHPTRELTSSEMSQVCRFVRRLGGIPLAIEMVASITAIGVLEDLHEIDPEIPSLSSGRVDHLGRHEQLSTVIESSLAKMSPTARAMLERLWVFDAGFAWQTARESFGGSPSEAMCALRELQDLSVIYTLETRHGTRFMVLRLVREVMQSTLERGRQVAAIEWGAHLLTRGLSPEDCLGYRSKETVRYGVREADNIIAVVNLAIQLGLFELAADTITPHTAAFKWSEHTPSLIALAESLGAKVDSTRRMQLACLAATLAYLNNNAEPWPDPIVDRFEELAEESQDNKYLIVARMFSAYRTTWYKEEHEVGAQRTYAALQIPQEQRSPATGALMDILGSECLQGTMHTRAALKLIEHVRNEVGLREGVEEELFLNRLSSANTNLQYLELGLVAAKRLQKLSWESENLGHYAHSFYLEGWNILQRGEFEDALQIFVQGHEVLRKYVPHDKALDGVFRWCAIYSCILTGRFDEARRRRNEVITNPTIEILFGMYNDDLSRAQNYFCKMFEKGMSFSRFDISANILDYAASIALRLGAPDLASQLCGEADAMRNACEFPQPIVARLIRGEIQPVFYPSTEPERRKRLVTDVATLFKL